LTFFVLRDELGQLAGFLKGGRMKISRPSIANLLTLLLNGFRLAGVKVVSVPMKEDAGSVVMWECRHGGAVLFIVFADFCPDFTKGTLRKDVIVSIQGYPGTTVAEEKKQLCLQTNSTQGIHWAVRHRPADTRSSPAGKQYGEHDLWAKLADTHRSPEDYFLTWGEVQLLTAEYLGLSIPSDATASPR
jgi:hypothetical protein